MYNLHPGLVVFTAEVDKLGKAMKQAKAADIRVVDEQFLDDVGKSPAAMMQLIVQHSIATWGADVSESLCLYSTVLLLRIEV